MSSSYYNSYWLIIIIFVVISIPSWLCQYCDGKKVSGSAKLSGVGTEHTISKFAFSPGGTSKVSVKVTTGDNMYVDERSLKLYLYSDENWDQVQRAPSCQLKTQLAALHRGITFTFRQELQEDSVDATSSSSSSSRNSYSDEFTMHISQKGFTRPRYWYFTMADCSLEMFPHNEKDTPPIQYDITIWDEYPLGTYTHLPNEEQTMEQLHNRNVMVTTCLTLWILFRTYSRARSTRGEIHFASVLLLLTCMLSISSSLCQIYHLKKYLTDGVGSYTFDALSAHFEALCDASIALILMAIAVLRWTLPTDIKCQTSSSFTFSPRILLWKDHPTTTTNNNKKKNAPNILVIFCLTIVALHSILAQWGRLYDEDFDCYHDLDHLPGKLLFLLRFLLGIGFLGGITTIRTTNSTRYVSQNLRKFFTQFAIVGIVWFLSLPTVAYILSASGSSTNGIVPPYRRHQFLSTLAIILQFASLTALSWLFLASSNASPYHKISLASTGENSDSLISTTTTTSTSLTSTGGGLGNNTRAKSYTFKIGKTKLRMD